MIPQLFVLIVLSAVVVYSFDHPRVQCMTTKGPLVIEVYRDWAPLGADRFLELVKDDFYTDIAFFRCVKRFLTQFGITDNKSKKHWHRKEIKDDPNLNIGIKKNFVSYAGGGPNTRSTQLFIAFEDLDFLGKEPWETPFGQVIEGQSTLDALYTGYGDIPPFGHGPDQQEIHRQGNGYIRTLFPQVDFIQSCHLIDPAVAAAAEEAKRAEELRAAAAATALMEQHNDASKGGGGKEETQGEEPEGVIEGLPRDTDNDNDAVLDNAMEGSVQAERQEKSFLRGNEEPVGGVKAGKHAILDGNAASLHIIGREGEVIGKAVFFLCLAFAVLFFYMRYYSVVISSKSV